MHKRALGAAAVTGVAALALSACGGSSPTTPSNTGAAGHEQGRTSTGVPETPSGTAAPVRDANVDLVIWTDADRSKAVQKYADQFAAENGVTVKVQISTDTRTQFKDATKVGKGPDVIVGAHDWLGELVQNSTVAPVNLASDVAAKFLPKAIEATKFNGQSYGVPYAVENIGLMYNKDLVPTPPKTMDELVATGEKLVKEGKAKQVLSQFVSKVGNAYFAYPYLSAFPERRHLRHKPNGDYDPNKVIVNSARLRQGWRGPRRARQEEGPLDQRRRHEPGRALRHEGRPVHDQRPVERREGQGGRHQLRHRPAAEPHRRRRDAAVPRRPDVLRLEQGQERRPRAGVRHELHPAQGRPAGPLRGRQASAGPQGGLRPGRCDATPTSRRGTRPASRVRRCRTSPR